MASSINFNSSIRQLKERGIISIFSQPKTQECRFEILEFHGDSTLSYLISTYLLNYKTYYNPHLLTRLRSLASSNQILYDFFNLFELDDFVSEEELPKDGKNIKPKADIVECLISELSSSKDADAELLLKGIVGFLISVGEKELDRECPFILRDGVLKQAKPQPTTLNYKSNYYSNNNQYSNHNNHHSNNYHNNHQVNNNTKSVKKSSLGTVLSNDKNVISSNSSKNVMFQPTKILDRNEKQPKAMVSYVVDNKSSLSLMTPGSVEGYKNSSNSSSCPKKTIDINLVKPIDITNSFNENNYNGSKLNGSKGISKTNVIDDIIKAKDSFITPNSISHNYIFENDNEDVPLSPFSVALALNSNTC